MAELDVALVAADREVWSGKASLVVAKTADGDVGIMPKHQPILSLLKPSVITIRTVVDGAPGETLRAALHGGFISVADDRVSLLGEADLKNRLRADEIAASLTPFEALANAPRQDNHLFVVPKMVE